MMSSYSMSSQCSFFLLIAVSGWFLVETNENVEDVYSEPGSTVLVNVCNQSFNTENDFMWLKGSSQIVARYRNGSKVYGKFINRVEAFSNGTLKFNITTKDDEGEYKFEVHNNEGKLQCSRDFKLHLLEKLSTPVLNITCVSERDVFMSCEVRGGIPFNFYLNDQKLTEDNAVFSSDGKKATLKNSTSIFGNKTFFCKIENPVSKIQTAPRELTCAGTKEGHHYVQVIIVILVVVVGLIILVGVAYCFFQKSL
ncbi:hepatocyte cell adhesion molecule-like isoform X1 [Chiloscyllium plagiosum]|uniref:hepatocyte cell adhesion molecule-like isoform X1 n=1 Tax=Chiloscyllium plagiosum TaxID=36176 RepID=UPI001CB7B133|nr:hepatocyte cell adhesion molecule-like isoform X1 [Chiloscyllium plagiosum]